MLQQLVAYMGLMLFSFTKTLHNIYACYKRNFALMCSWNIFETDRLFET